MNHLEALMAALLDILGVSYTPVGLAIGTLFITGLVVTIALMTLFVAFAKTHDNGVAEGLGHRDEAYNEGFEQGILRGELNILVAEDSQFSE